MRYRELAARVRELLVTSVVRWPARLLVDELYYGSVVRFPEFAPSLCRSVAWGLGNFANSLTSTLKENARLALGPSASEAAVQRTAAAVLRGMQDSIRDTLLSGNECAESLRSRVTGFVGQEGYYRARAQGGGLLVASIHMGAFEPCLALLCKYERRVHVLFQPDPMPRFERARSSLRRSLGVIEHRLSDGLDAWMSLRDALEAGEAVVMHADRVMPRQQGARTHFLGVRDAILPTGPVRLALGCGAAIMPTYCRRQSGGLFVQMDEPICHGRENLRSEAVPQHPAQQRLVASMERVIRGYPDQWMAFWKVRGVSA